MSNGAVAIIGRNLRDNDRLPRVDNMWTTLSTWRDHRSKFTDIPNLMVWDCHDLNEEMEEPYEGRIFDIRRENAIREAMLRRYGYRFSSQICWMVAHAINGNYSGIHLKGVTLADNEVANQLSNLSFLLGIAWVEDIAVTIDKPSQVLPYHYYPKELEY
jgi:hypothetical protein